MSRILAGVLALILLAGCGGRADTSENHTVGFEAGDGTVTIVPEDRRVAAPELSGRLLDGRTFSTTAYQGKILVINVWGSWCAPCRAEAPQLVEADKRLGDGVAFLGLNTRDLEQGPARAFERTFKLSYPSLFDPDGELLLGFGQLPPKAIPSTLVVDEQGRVAARILGGIDAKTLVGIVEEVRS